MRLQEGITLDGRYTLSRRLGSGGMADVWCAQDSGLGREGVRWAIEDMTEVRLLVVREP